MNESRLPTRAQALSFLVEAGCSKSVVQHCKKVSELAVKIAKMFQKKGHRVDVQLIEVSGLLHDIGRSKTHTVDHAFIGSQIARSFGLPDSVAKIIERHVGGGIPKDEAKKIGWPPRDYLPQTLEEKIVCYADKRVEALRTVQMKKALKPYAASLGSNHPAIRRIRRLHDEIEAVTGDIQ